MYKQQFAWLDRHPDGALVAANQRLARTLTAAFNTRAQNAGATVWQSPRIFSWSDWLADCWERARLRGGTGSQLTLLSDTESAVLWEQIVLADQGVASDSAALAQLAAAAWKLVCACDAFGAQEWVTAGLSLDQQRFLRWSAEFRARCEEAGWLDRQELAGSLVAELNAGKSISAGPIGLTGFNDYTAAQLKLRNALTQAGTQVAEILADLTGNPPAKQFAAVTDADELETAARWARAQLETDSALTVGIIIPDLAQRAGQLNRVFMDVFEPGWRTAEVGKTPVNISYGEPLANKPRVAAALNALQLIAHEYAYETVSLALRTPFLRAARVETGVRAALDLKLRDRLGAAFLPHEAGYYAERSAPEFKRLLDGLAAATKASAAARSLSEWAVWITSQLEQAGWPGEDPIDSQGWQELEAWQRLLAEFASSARVREAVDWPTARDLLTRLCWQRLHQPQGVSGAVQIMGMLETAGHEFDRLWVAGMAAGEWPAAAQPNPLLPFALQRRFNLPGSSPEHALEEARRATQRLAGSAPAVIFSWHTLKDGQYRPASSLIAQYESLANTGGWADPLWLEQLVGSATLEHLEHDQPEPLSGNEPARGGAYLFNLEHRCPLRAFLELRLGAAEVDPPDPGLSYRARGILAHAVLEAFYARYADSTALRQLASAAVASELAGIFERERQRLPVSQREFVRALVDIEAGRILPLLTKFVELDQARHDFRVVATERAEEVRVGQVSVRLKLDRLDQLASGEFLLLDYKTGQVNRRDWNPVSPGDLQLPLYAIFTATDISAIAFAQLSAHGVLVEGLGELTEEIAGIARPEKLRSKFVSIHGEVLDDWDSLSAGWRDCLVALAERFARGDTSVNPKYSDDARGQYAVLTRIHELPAHPDDAAYGDGE
jgi:probable DNA repair protein